MNNKSKLKWMTALALSFTIVLSGCAGGNNNDAAGGNLSVNAGGETGVPSEEPEAGAGENAESTESPEATEEAASTEQPTATPAPEESVSPKETAAPTDQSATSKPAVKPSPKPTVKPTDKPTAKPTVKPSSKPSTKPSEPAPKPTEKPSPKPTETPAADVKVADIVSAIKDKVQLSMMMEVSGEQVSDFYNGINPDDLLEEAVFQQAMIIIRASEFSVVRLKSGNDYDTIKEAFEFRAETVQKSFEWYLQDQYKLAQNYQIIRNGNYVLFSISEDQETIADIFNGFFE